MDGFPRSSGCLLAHSHQKVPSSIPSLHPRQRTLVFQSSPLRSVTCPIPFHTHPPLAPQHSEITRSTSTSLLGRLDLVGKVGGITTSSCQYGMRPTHKTGLANKFRKITPDTLYRPHLARSPLATSTGSLGPPEGESARHLSSSTGNDQQETILPSRMGAAGGQVRLCCSDPSISTACPSATLCPGLLQQNSRQGQEDSPTACSPCAPSALDVSGESVSHPSLSYRRTCSGDVDRRFHFRMGRAYTYTGDIRGMVTDRKITPYKHPGIKGCMSHDSESQLETSNDPPLYRQPGSHVRHQQDEMQESIIDDRAFQSPGNPSNTDTGSESLPHHLKIQHKGGCAQPTTTCLNRNLSPSTTFQSTVQLGGGKVPNRCHGFQGECSASPVLLSSKGQLSTGSQRTDPRLGPMELNLHFPPSLANSTNTTETQDVLRARPHNPPLDPSGAMVPGNSRQSQEMETPTLLRDSKYWVTKLRELDRLQFLKLALAQEHGDTIADTLISAHRPSTNRQAQSVWKKFQAWLPADAEEITHNTVLQFLIFLHSTLNLNARTIINYRGCLALPLKTAFKIDFDHESFGLLTRSIFIKNPPARKKIPNWSLEAALETFSSPRFALPHISSKDLLLKTLFLVALASGNRASELAATRRTGTILRAGTVILPIEPSFLFKTQSVSRSNPPPISFPTLGERDTLCPWRNLNQYIASTSPPAGSEAIFLHPTSNVPLTAGRLSYWLTKAIVTADKSAIKPAGHDIRKIAFSMAFTRGVPLEDILQRAFWHSPHVFIRKYLCMTSNPAHSVVAGRSV